MSEIEELHMKLLVHYFDCCEHVNHEILKESIGELIRMVEDIKENTSNIKHRLKK